MSTIVMCSTVVKPVNWMVRAAACPRSAPAPAAAAPPSVPERASPVDVDAPPVAGFESSSEDEADQLEEETTECKTCSAAFNRMATFSKLTVHQLKLVFPPGE